MKITAAQLEQITEHALRDAPNECCGLIATDQGIALEVIEAANEAASPLRFEISGVALLRHLDRIEGEGHELGGIYHSHTRSEPYPSQTDINFAAGWPGVEWLIVGVGQGQPVVRSYLIDGADVTEVAVEIIG